jgi:Ca2+/Na+ antiporter
VVIGSNVFNLAALLGFAAVVVGRIALHRRVIAMEGVVAVWIAVVCLAVVVGIVSAAVGLGLVLLLMVPYLVLLGLPRDRLERLGLPARWATWLEDAIAEEEIELEAAIHPQPGRSRDSILAVVAVLIVVGASVAMEQTASKLGARHAIPDIVVGGLVLAAVTSLPNGVAAVYLASHRRGPATLSTAMNSNALNVTVGLLLPATILGLGATSGQGTLVAGWCLGLTVFALAIAYISRGLRRGHGVLIIAAYLAFAGLVLATAYRSHVGMLLSIALPALVGVALAVWLFRHPKGARSARPHANGNGAQAETTRAIPAGDQSLVAGWSINRVKYLALAISSLIAATDAMLGHHVILIGLLIVGPCCGLVTGRRAQTAIVSAWAIALAVILGLPDQIWGTSTHLAFLAAVIVVAVASTTSAAMIEQRR